MADTLKQELEADSLDAVSVLCSAFVSAIHANKPQPVGGGVGAGRYASAYGGTSMPCLATA